MRWWKKFFFTDEEYRRHLLLTIQRRQLNMAVDLSRLVAAQSRLSADVAALLAQSDPAQDAKLQADVDAVTATLETDATSIEARLPPAAPVV